MCGSRRQYRPIRSPRPGSGEGERPPEVFCPSRKSARVRRRSGHSAACMLRQSGGTARESEAAGLSSTPPERSSGAEEPARGLEDRGRGEETRDRPCDGATDPNSRFIGGRVVGRRIGRAPGPTGRSLELRFRGVGPEREVRWGAARGRHSVRSSSREMRGSGRLGCPHGAGSKGQVPPLRWIAAAKLFERSPSAGGLGSSPTLTSPSLPPQESTGEGVS